MLVLTRKEGQTIRIGADITVTVLSVRGSQVRIGIDAPRATAVLRSELVLPPCPPSPAPQVSSP